jgi:hypothetical protein
MVIPMLMTHIHMLTTILGMPLNLLKDVVAIGLYGISSPGLFLLLASFGLLSSAQPSISIP